MGISEFLWCLLCLLIIPSILLNDPKTRNNGFGTNQFPYIFSSVKESQIYILNATWALICGFFVLTFITN